MHQENRESPFAFVWQSCHYSENADLNAGKVIAGRGVRQVIDQGPAGSRNSVAAM